MTDRQIEQIAAPQERRARIAMEASEYHIRMAAKYQLPPSALAVGER